MTNKSFQKFLGQLLAVVAGIYVSWSLNFFIPFTLQYPPLSTYQNIAEKTTTDTVIAAPGPHYLRNAMGEFWLGKHYRSAWTLPVKVPVFRINEVHGGMKILKKGGGMQTTSFTLADNSGTEYALRSVDKNPVNVLPEFFRYTFVASFVRDQVSATDPYASQLVAYLSSQAGIPHTDPELYYILPEDTCFHRFGLRAGGFYNLSPKLPQPESLQRPGERLEGIYSSEEMLKLLAESKGKASVDTNLFLKCRLFDLLISDWDRHPGQWDWAGFSAKNHTVFRPIPKDRDQALGHYKDGVVPYLLTRTALHKIASFTPEYEDVKGFAINGRVLDNLILKNVSGKTFEDQAKALQIKLPDAVLQAAVKKYPSEVEHATAQKTLLTLKSRRQKLIEASQLLHQAIQERETN
ncbi:hypothetical protein [Adhaeribacter terreus]|uniref:Uncharacterized protein n=1 Tax=Adhaeribacter terreus TaxID=529703 RepID=A0ABW0EFA9_9BACT